MFKKSSILFVLFFSFILFSCGEKLDLNNLSGDNFNGQGEQNNTPDEGGKNDTVVVPVPKISPAAGDYAEGFKTITITVDSNDSSIDIFYTTDGSEPNQTSNRYTEPFTILGSKTVRAIAFYKKTSSAIATANYNLNAGKTASQLGVIKGTFNLAENLSDEVKTKLASSTIYISSSDLPGIVREGKMGDSFYIDTLDTSKSYDFYFSNKAPGTPLGSRAAATVQTDSNGEPVLAIKIGVKPSDGAGTDLGKVTLKPTGTIIGKAFKYSETGELETDHAGITVFIPGTSYAAYTDKDGNFSMSLVPQGMYTIRAMYAGYTFAEQENILLSTDNNDEPRAEVESEFALYYAKGTVKGSVLLSDRTSDFAGINIVLADSSNIHSYSATTTSTGSWTINDVTPGTYSVEFHKDGYVDQKVNDIIVSGARITEIPRIVLKEDGGSIFGKVLVGNSSIAGVSLIAERPVDDIDGASSSKTYYALSKDDGSYRFESVAPGLYTVTAIYPGYKSVNQSNVSVSIGDEIGLADLIILEKTTYTVTGSCVLAGMESGFEGTSVLLQSADNNIKKSTTTNTEGTYTITDIDAGSYILTFSRSGFITNSSVTVDVGTKSIAVVENVVLYSNAGTVTGTVTLESAESFEGIAILLTRESDGKNYSTVTDSAGHFAVAGVAPGTYRVQATKNGYNTGLSDPFTVSSGITSSPADQQLSISLRSLYGTVTLEGRTDYTGVRITATKTTSTTEIYSALSNKEGFYALSGMTPGEYILSYAYEGYRSYTGSSVSLSSDSSLNVDGVQLVKATGKISGIVNLEGCTDHSGITVSLVGTDYTSITNTDGSYEFSVPSGNYSGGVRFEKEDYQLTAKAETIPVLTDSTYGVLTETMKATANTLKGIIKLAGTEDYSDITVTVDGLDSSKIFYKTSSDGNWQLDHIPLGYQTIRFSKLNVPDVTVQKEVIANDFIEIGTLEMIPDSATLKGFVFLDGMTDNAGITVTISTLNKADITARTTSDGAFTANNILASGEHTITFSKEGWNSHNITINDLEPLEVRQIGAAREYVLTDTTAPDWGSTPVIINSGANFANSTKLHVDLSPNEKGSGIDKMSVQIARVVDGVISSLYPSTYNWMNYQVGFDYDLDELPDQYHGNGTYTLYIALKDKSGNISTKAEKSITITDLVTSLAGVLTGDKLHLTEENSPYLVEGDCLVSEGQTLVIDPGVEVRFAGEYSISVSGSIVAIGTKEKKILFTSNVVDEEYTYTQTEWKEWWDEYGDYQCGDFEVTYTDKRTEYWKGIAINGGSVTTENTYRYVSGNIMENCEFEYANTPLTIKAGAYINKCYFHDCLNHVVENSTNEYYNVIFINNTFENGIVLYNISTFANNIVSSFFSTGGMSSWKGVSSISNNTFIDTEISFEWNSCAEIQNNVFANCFINYYAGFDDNSPIIKNNNFTNCPTLTISTTREYEPSKYFSLTNNYWGKTQTEELNNKGNEANISFISDYYDNFNYARFDYSNWATEPFENCGYSEKGFVVFDYSVDDSFHSESKETTIPISMDIHYSQNPIAFMRFAQSREALKNASWQAYSSETSFTVDKEKSVDGIVTVYAQIKDTEDCISSVVSHDFIYDMPGITVNIEDNTEYDARTSSSFSINYSATDRGGISNLELFLNDKLVNDMYWDRDGGGSQSSYTFNLITVQTGRQSLKIVAKDSAGNISEKTIHFSVSRDFNLSDVENVSYSTTTGQLLKDANTVHLWHLDNDGKEDLGTAEIKSYTHTNGGFEGAASYLNTEGTDAMQQLIPINISTNAFTVEFWSRGNGNLYLNKSSDFIILNNYGYSYWNEDNWCDYYWNNGILISRDSNIEALVNTEIVGTIRSDDKWHYWAYVFDGIYAAIYCDGVCVSFQNGFTFSLKTNNNNMSISASGIIDELRISNCARSADEISSYYKTAKPILDANTGSLEAIVY